MLGLLEAGDALEKPQDLVEVQGIRLYEETRVGSCGSRLYHPDVLSS